VEERRFQRRVSALNHSGLQPRGRNFSSNQPFSTELIPEKVHLTLPNKSQPANLDIAGFAES